MTHAPPGPATPSREPRPVTGAEFKAWLEFMATTRKWSSREAARQLGCGGGSIVTWTRKGAPTYIGLACAALAVGLPGWNKLQGAA